MKKNESDPETFKTDGNKENSKNREYRTVSGAQLIAGPFTTKIFSTKLPKHKVFFIH